MIMLMIIMVTILFKDSLNMQSAPINGLPSLIYLFSLSQVADENLRFIRLEQLNRVTVFPTLFTQWMLQEFNKNSL